MAVQPISPFMDLSGQKAGIITLCVVPIALLIGELANAGRGLALIGFTCIAISIRFSWPLRKERWFWCVIVVLAFAHACAIALLSWSWLESLGKAAGLLVYPDWGIITGAIYLAYRAVYGRPAKAMEDDPDDLPTYSQCDLNL